MSWGSRRMPRRYLGGRERLSRSNPTLASRLSTHFERIQVVAPAWLGHSRLGCVTRQSKLLTNAVPSASVRSKARCGKAGATFSNCRHTD